MEMTTFDGSNTTKQDLVILLREAAHLEHTLLNSYLYAACSIRATPGAYATIKDTSGKEVENKNRALHFTLARQWKQAMIGVAHEEMLHLHYVNCLLRALGEPAEFALPIHDPQGGWRMDNWAPPEEPGGIYIPMEPISTNYLKQCVLWESTDAMQDLDPQQLAELCHKISEWEMDLHIAGIVHEPGGGVDKEIQAQLLNLYKRVEGLQAKGAMPMWTQESVTGPTFRSIGDFYTNLIKPAFKLAYDNGWVVNYNRDFNNELLDPAYAAQGFLPIGPIHRTNPLQQQSSLNAQQILRNFKDVDNIINEIIDEGEGFTDFIAKADGLLAGEFDGKKFTVDEYANQLARQAYNPRQDMESFAQTGQELRKSHLYRFSAAYGQLKQVEEDAQNAGLVFDPVREQVITTHNGISSFASEIAPHFNTVYLVLCGWLRRLYEVRDWQEDKPRRQAIEMLASWPLMSLGIRPFLEMASYFNADVQKDLFRQDPEGLLPDAARLVDLFHLPQLTEPQREEVDELCMELLEQVALWAKKNHETVGKSIPESVREEVLIRLLGLSRLDEFKRQFPFRVSGGYSDRNPDLTYTQLADEAGEVNPAKAPERFSEAPFLMDKNNEPLPIFDETLVMRLRFRGFGRVQMATDPEPPTDEAGSTGTLMMQPSDTGIGLTKPPRFDRSIYFQPNEGAIIRGPAPGVEMPDLGVNVVDVSLMVANNASANMVPVGVMNSVGAVQAAGVMKTMQVEGFQPIYHGTPEEFGVDKVSVDLLPRDGRRPYHVGENHLIWQDGEPVDPLEFSITDSGGTWGRKIYGNDVPVEDFEPLQRLKSGRGPVGFLGADSVPEWALENLPPYILPSLSTDNYPAKYFGKRRTTLQNVIKKELASGSVPDQAFIDKIVSFAERLYLVNLPKGTSIGWLRAFLNYGHSVSGVQTNGNSAILQALSKATGVELSLQPELADRSTTNSRWLTSYCFGMMDTDAFAQWAYGELYVPLSVKTDGSSKRFTRSWKFPAGSMDAIRLFACDFTKPFWANFTINPGTPASRTAELPDKTKITEVESTHDENGYTYHVDTFPGAKDNIYRGSMIAKEETDGTVVWTWDVEFAPADAAGYVSVMNVLSGAVQGIEAAFESKYGVKEISALP